MIKEESMAGKLNGNPWLSIWLNPKPTIRAIVNYDPKHRFILLAIIYGLPMALNFAQSSSMIESIPLWAILLAAAVISPFIGALGITVSSLLLTWTGKWIGGRGNFDKVRAAVAWSNVPNLVTVFLWGALVITFGSQAFARGFTESTFVGYQSGVIFIVFLMESIISIWGFIILLRMLGEVQRFSTWKALLNIVIPLVIIIGAIWSVSWVISNINMHPDALKTQVSVAPNPRI
jgi:hypothetical protein